MLRQARVGAFLLVSAASTASAQPVVPPGPATVLAEPAWSRTVHMADGRVFVTDGGFALDAAVARPKTMPPDIKGGVAAQALARHLALHNATEVRLGDLKTGARPNTFIAPGGTIVNGNYVSFLRRAAPAATLRMKGPVDPVVIVLGGAPVGVFMPIKP